LTRSSTWPSAERISTGVSIALARSALMTERPSRLGSMRSDDQHVVAAVERHREAVLAVRRPVGDVADLAKALTR
jgi:hypothetical protein